MKRTQPTFNHGERGGIIAIFTLFVPVLIGVLIISTDGFFWLQSRMDQQNISEYMNLAALSGFYEETMDENEFAPRRENVINALNEVAQDNAIIGMGTSAGWNMSTPGSCIGAKCSGSGWKIIFGNWDGATFVKAEPVIPGEPDSIDTSMVNAISVTLTLPVGSSMLHFFANSETPTQVYSNSVATSYILGGRRHYKLIKTVANGSAIGGGEDEGDDENCGQEGYPDCTGMS